MTRLLYIDCFSGIAGDMMVGALLDLGVPEAHMRDELAKIGVGGWSLRVEKGTRHRIVGTDVHVDVELAPRAHTHDHAHGHDHAHSHEAEHEHGRRWREIRDLLAGSALSADVKALALRIFEKLAAAEGKLHGISPDDVHFHEVGALDAIVDICGAAIGLTWLGVDRIVSAPVPAPRGFVRCDHGRVPLPAPATLALLAGAMLKKVDATGEWVTPTGAAILAATVTAYGPIPAMRVDAIGYGVGDRNPPDRPNLLRLVLGTVPEAALPEDLLLEANIDDMSPELFGHLTERLFALGAYDVWLTPIQMKKGRPATALSVLCDTTRREVIVAAILRESTSIGLRMSPVVRYKTAQSIETIDTALGPVQVKVARDGAEVVNRAPEYEDCRRLALERGLPLKDVLHVVWAALGKR